MATCFGIEINLIEELAKAGNPIRFNEQSDLNLIFDSDLQFKTQSDPITHVVFGRQIDSTLVPENANPLMSSNNDSRLNPMLESCLHRRKHD
jgi:hypothetical protein